MSFEVLRVAFTDTTDDDSVYDDELFIEGGVIFRPSTSPLILIVLSKHVDVLTYKSYI